MAEAKDGRAHARGQAREHIMVQLVQRYDHTPTAASYVANQIEETQKDTDTLVEIARWAEQVPESFKNFLDENSYL